MATVPEEGHPRWLRFGAKGLSRVVTRRPRRAGKGTNLALLAVLPLAFATGLLGFAVGTGWVRVVLVSHGVAGLAVVGLSPWKSVIVRRGLARRRPGRWAGVVFGVLIVACIASGVLHSTGLAVTLGPVTAMQTHVFTALAAVPVAVWHIASRRIRIHRTDLGRRKLLRAATLVGASTAVYATTETALRWSGGPGSRRRFTGSHSAGKGDVPVTQWLMDRVPSIRPEDWSLLVRSPAGERTLGYADLATARQRLRATLDCTGGWFAEQEWEGLMVDRLFQLGAEARSIEVVSATGYARRFPLSDSGHLLLAVRMGGRPLAPGHGFPARLVAPGRRGFWWVKWVSRIELSTTPWWWQPPFPLR